MAQLTVRATDELVARVRAAASQKTTSLNAYVTAVLDAATNPDLIDNETERLRERLRQAGLLAEAPAGTRSRPPKASVARARAAAGKGTSLAKLVAADR